MSHASVQLGKAGEDLACGELERRGYAIVARRYRIRTAEIDIIAEHEGTVVFVEVKARDGRAFGRGADAVTWRKRRRIVGAARHFLSAHRLDGRPCRFDVVSIDVEGGHETIEVVQNAFLA